jgi:hypothetical protein
MEVWKLLLTRSVGFFVITSSGYAIGDVGYLIGD